jgi:hypothetical protein
MLGIAASVTVVGSVVAGLVTVGVVLAALVGISRLFPAPRPARPRQPLDRTRDDGQNDASREHGRVPTAPR